MSSHRTLNHNRLIGHNNFSEGLLARLDLPVALAAAARWSDTDRARLHDSLRPLTTVGLDKRQLSVCEVAVLFSLMDKPNSEHLTALVERAGQDGPDTAAQLAEEWASDLLVDRMDGFENLFHFIAQHGRGISSARLAAQIKYVEALAKAAEVQAPPQQIELPPNPHRPPDILDKYVWTIDDLVDAQRLAHEIEDLIKALTGGGAVSGTGRSVPVCTDRSSLWSSIGSP